MKAVETLFTSRYVHQITLDDVARQANVGKGTIYRYFKDKNELFFQTAISGHDRLCELVKRSVPADATFEEQLLGACREIRDFHRRHRPLLRMMRSEDARMSLSKGSMPKRWAHQRKKLVAAISEILARGVGEGKVRADVQVEMLARCLLGMLRAYSRGHRDPAEPDNGFEQLVDVFLNGAGAAEKPQSHEAQPATSHGGGL